VNGFATVQFIDTLRRDVRFTARIPINIGAGQDIPSYILAGEIKDSLGAPMAGVTVNIKPLSIGGTEQKNVATDAIGEYKATGLAAATYEVTPSLAGVSFTPPFAIVTITNEVLTGVDFAASGTSLTYSISGRVSTSGGLGVPGATVSLTGKASGTTTTAANGDFILTELASGSYTITPTRAGYTFTPASVPVTIVNNNVSDRNFTATAVTQGLSIFGLISDQGGLPIPGATLSLTGAAVASTLTDSLGSYSLPGLSNGEYTVTPSLSGYRFTPSMFTVTLNGANVGQNFLGEQVAIEKLQVTRAVVSTRGKAAAVTGPKWSVRGKGTPGAVISIFLGPDLNGELIGTATANRMGVWRYNGRSLTLPLSGTAISVLSSGGGQLLNQVLKIR
jgi:hypothetical protein